MLQCQLIHLTFGGKHQENGDDTCVWTISIEVNGAEVSKTKVTVKMTVQN